jgi:hypothetical protein
MVCVNLPVSDLAASRAFFSGLGFSFNEAFSDATSACLVVSESASIMLLTPGKWAQFVTLPQPDARTTTGVLTAISLESRAEVGQMAELALSMGGSRYRPAEDHEFMVTHAICDPDGNVFELFWIDQAAIQSSA